MGRWGGLGLQGGSGAAAQSGRGRVKTRVRGGGEHGVLPPPLVTSKAVAMPSRVHAHTHSCAHALTCTCTLTCTHPHGRHLKEEGKQEGFGPRDPALPHAAGKKRSVTPLPAAVLFLLWGRRSKKCGPGRAGPGRALGLEASHPSRERRGSCPCSVKKEPRAVLPARGQRPSCLQYSECIFLHPFKYRQNKNHIFVRQQ